MDEDNDGLDEGTKKTKNPLYVLKKEEFIGKSNHEIYMHCLNKEIVGPKDEYNNLIKLIKTGKEELPDDPKSEDSEKIKKLYGEACAVEKVKIPKEVTEKYGWADPASKAHLAVTLTADDGGSHTFPPELFNESKESFKENQYSTYLSDLREIDSKIYHFLIKYKIISKLPSPTDILKEQLKEEFLSDENEDQKV